MLFELLYWAFSLAMNVGFQDKSYSVSDRSILNFYFSHIETVISFTFVKWQSMFEWVWMCSVSVMLWRKIQFIYLYPIA